MNHIAISFCLFARCFEVRVLYRDDISFLGNEPLCVEFLFFTEVIDTIQLKKTKKVP